MINKEHISKTIKIYSCNHKKNKECNKKNCKYRDGIEGCTNTTNFKFAKRTPLNYIKYFINKIRGN